MVIPEEELAALVENAVSKALGSHSGGPMLVDKQVLAQKLGCSAAHIDNLRKCGLPVVRLGGQTVRFAPNEVLDWLRQQGSNETE